MPIGIELVDGSIPMTSVAGWNLQHCDTAIAANHNCDIRRIIFFETYTTALDINRTGTDTGVTLKPSLLTNNSSLLGFRVRDRRVPGNNLAGGTKGSFEYQRSRIGVTIVAAV